MGGEGVGLDGFPCLVGCIFLASSVAIGCFSLPLRLFAVAFPCPHLLPAVAPDWLERAGRDSQEARSQHGDLEPGQGSQGENHLLVRCYIVLGRLQF